MNTKVLAKKIRRIFNDDSQPLHVVHQYWKNPKDGTNQPETYFEGTEKSQYLFEKISEVHKQSNILEIGCNVGRNLDYLYQKGYYSLSGVEISRKAISMMKEMYSETFEDAYIYNSSIEDYFSSPGKSSYDLIYTMAVLEHIHTKSEWIFEKMVSCTKRYIVTIEDEESISWKHFPRNYKRVFENLGMKQLYCHDCSNIPGFHKGFKFRMFEKKPETN